MKEISCILCHRDDYLKLFYSKDRLLKVDETEFQVVKCRKCGMVYLNPQPTPEEIAKYYPTNYAPYLSQGPFKPSQILRMIEGVKLFLLKNYPKFSYKIKNIKRLIFKSHTHTEHENIPGSNIDEISCLDFGCGSGRNMERLREDHPRWEISGLDNSTIACETASAKGFKVYCGNVDQVNLPKKSFDRVYMNSVIEHLHDPRLALQKVNFALKPGGKLKVMTPNISSIGARLFRQYWHALDTPRHLYLFNQTTLKSMLEETGFRIKNLEYKKGMSVEIKSIHTLINRKDRRMNPLVWKLSVPIGNVMAKFGQASTMIVNAEKIREI